MQEKEPSPQSEAWGTQIVADVEVNEDRAWVGMESRLEQGQLRDRGARASHHRFPGLRFFLV